MEITNKNGCNIENVNVREEIIWFENTREIVLKYEYLLEWIVRGPPITHIDDQVNFIDQTLLKNVIKAKDIFNELDIRDLNKARCRANPFENIKNVFFMNRAALKMANIDSATGFMFSNIDRDPVHRKKNGAYYFADVCAGPGGFSEYILWRKKWSFKGFGFTLKGVHDFKLHESTCASGVTFQSYYGASGDGDVCNPENIADFRRKVLLHTEGVGVHFMMSDGGFSVEGNENLQEVLSKQIYICQCLVALEIVRPNGHYVTKLFDLCTMFSVGMIYLITKCFKKVTIIKPNTSRPANAERYLVCSYLRDTSETEEIKKYFKKIVYDLWIAKQSKYKNNQDILEIVPISVIKQDKNFFNYIYDSNCKLARKQEVGLAKLSEFSRNPYLVETRQESLRSECLNIWNIPDRPKITNLRFTIDDLLSNFYNLNFLTFKTRTIISMKELKDTVTNIDQWLVVFLTSNEMLDSCHFFASTGSAVLKFLGNKWVKVKDLQLCKGTLLYGEIVNEINISDIDGTETIKPTLQVIDALRLGDVSLTDLPYSERIDCVKTYCEAVNFEAVPFKYRIRLKTIQNLSYLCNGGISYDLKWKSHTMYLPCVSFDCAKNFFNVNSLLLLSISELQSMELMHINAHQIMISGSCSKLNTETEIEDCSLPFHQICDHLQQISQI